MSLGEPPVLDFPARRGNGQRHPPKTRRDEGPQRKAKRAHLCATSLEKSTNDPGMYMKTKGKYNLSLRQKVSRSQTPAILGSDSMILRLTTVDENERTALECGDLTPPWNEVEVIAKAASSRRTPTCLRHTYFQSSRSCPSAAGHPETMKIARQ